MLIGAYLVRLFDPAAADWTPFFLALGALFLLYLLIDLFFLPRPVPPVLMLYARTGQGRPYRRDGDAPYWLAGDVYWVWRYLILTPAEINKFWERDWERVELWVRADGDSAGVLEWVVTDAHYRELWIPLSRLGSAESIGECEEEAVAAVRAASSGTWLVEVDADQIFHAPFFRVVSFLPEEGRVPVRRIGQRNAKTVIAHSSRKTPAGRSCRASQPPRASSSPCSSGSAATPSVTTRAAWLSRIQVGVTPRPPAASAAARFRQEVAQEDRRRDRARLPARTSGHHPRNSL